jgi:hypothetical protein
LCPPNPKEFEMPGRKKKRPVSYQSKLWSLSREMKNALVVELFRILPTLISCCCLTFATVSKSTAGSGFYTQDQGKQNDYEKITSN